MIQTTMNKIFISKNVLQNLSERSLPIKASYGIAKLINSVNAELAFFEEKRIKLCEKYGKLNKAENRYDIEDNENFNRELSELKRLDVELDVKPVVLTDDICLSAQELIAIEDFIEVSDLE